jgi:hypothetical protein
MTLPRDEPEILNGTRAWAEAQTYFQGIPDPTRTRYDVQCSWYGTSISEWEGSFCVIQAGSELEDLVGDIVQVFYRDRSCFLYCVGGADIPTPLALTRQAFLRIAALSNDEISVGVQPVVNL